VEKETWSLIVKQAGGQVAIKKTTANIDFAVVFDEDRVNNDAAAVGSIVASANVPIVRKEWLCQSLIHQRMLPADQYLLPTGDQGSRNKRTRQTNRRKIK
jgi:hypothetical protein